MLGPPPVATPVVSLPHTRCLGSFPPLAPCVCETIVGVKGCLEIPRQWLETTCASQQLPVVTLTATGRPAVLPLRLPRRVLAAAHPCV